MFYSHMILENSWIVKMGKGNLNETPFLMPVVLHGFLVVSL